jgi:hypothetical protein
MRSPSILEPRSNSKHGLQQDQKTPSPRAIQFPLSAATCHAVLKICPASQNVEVVISRPRLGARRKRSFPTTRRVVEVHIAGLEQFRPPALRNPFAHCLISGTPDSSAPNRLPGGNCKLKSGDLRSGLPVKNRVGLKSLKPSIFTEICAGSEQRASLRTNFSDRVSGGSFRNAPFCYIPPFSRCRGARWPSARAPPHASLSNQNSISSVSTSKSAACSVCLVT